jgi:hypothetical protein
VSFLRFVKRERLVNRKTDVFDAVSDRDGSNLGIIGFFPAWRKFVFEAQPFVVFDAVCLREIAEFCATQTMFWQKGLK